MQILGNCIQNVDQSYEKVRSLFKLYNTSPKQKGTS